jgi:hypothetical protein
MNMKIRTLVLALSILCTVASVVNAQPVTPPGNFGGADNYIMAAVAPTTNSSCGSSPKVMHNVAVTVVVTEPIVVASSSCTPNGFSFQLNANAPHTITGKSASYWQQFNILVQNSNDATSTIDAHTQLWSLVPKHGFSNDTTIGQVSETTTAPTIPAGYKLTWALDTDSGGNVTQVYYQVYDNHNHPLASKPGINIQVPTANIAPISSFELDLIGTGGCESTFQSGAGYIYYAANNAFTPQTQIPACAISTVTAEQSPNSAYGLLYQSSLTEQVQEFYISNYQWTNKVALSTGHGNASKTILGNSSFPLTLSSGGGNAVTLAPGDFRDLSWLGSSADASRTNALENSCSYRSSTTTCNQETGDYYRGLVRGTGGGNLFQWSTQGGVWINNVWTGWGPKGDGGVYTSVAPVTEHDMFLTRSNATSCTESTPGGACIYSAAQGSRPAKWHFGGTQVAVDSGQITTDLFTIDFESGAVYKITTGGNPKATALPRHICATGGQASVDEPEITLVADQIAVKGGVVFAIQDNDGLGGIVYEYNTGELTKACPDGTDGWRQVGTRSNFLSIATDLVAGQGGGLDCRQFVTGDKTTRICMSGEGCGVWATDSSNNAWCACYGSDTCTSPFPVPK